MTFYSAPNREVNLEPEDIGVDVSTLAVKFKTTSEVETVTVRTEKIEAITEESPVVGNYRILGLYLSLGAYFRVISTYTVEDIMKDK